VAGTLKLLGKQLRELGMTLSIWDHLGGNVGGFDPCCEFCQVVCDTGTGCVDCARDLAARIVGDAGPGEMSAWCGGCLVGVPVYRRRRLIGAAVGCFPVRRMLDEESLARMCDRMRLDRRHIADLLRENCRHCEDEAGDFLNVLQWLLQRDQEIRVAQNELATLTVNLGTTYEELSLLYHISGEMLVTQRPRVFLENVCNELLDVMSISTAAAIVYAHPAASEDEIIVTAGSDELGESKIKLLASTQIVPRFTKSKRAILDNRFVPAGDVELGGAVKNLIAVPLITEDSLIGVLIGLNKAPDDFDSVDLKLINSIGNQGSVFLANSHLYADLEDLLMGVLHALTASIDAKDPYTCGHSQRVAMISKRLAEERGFPSERVERIYLCGLLHDIGKLGVPESTLLKEGKLTVEEYESVKRHPDIGSEILGGIRQLDDVVVWIRAHHERPDGKGYPQGLKHEEIPVEGLIVGLADGFDAMTSDRTYRKGLSLEDAIEEIRCNSGTQFDPDCAETLLSLDLQAFLEDLRKSQGDVLTVGAQQETGR
jgi:HD-GYP domain-containing protein (c-di-GMP phosphodiesterase class II)